MTYRRARDIFASTLDALRPPRVLPDRRAEPERAWHFQSPTSFGAQ
jgi:hypothetical protein